MLLRETLVADRYRIIRQLGKGGMGTVYEALDERLGTVVALKENHHTDDRLRKQFEREARILAKLRHPALIRVIDHLATSDRQFLVMDFVGGEDLASMVERAPLPLPDVLRWADELLDALAYLHSQTPPILHRDIKPQNLKVWPAGGIVLLDFGLAKDAAIVSRLHSSGSVFGYTPSYAALEQMQGTGTEERSDIYSVGATLYNLCTGQRPVDVLTRVTATADGRPDPLRWPSDLLPELPASVADVIVRAMSIGKSARFASAREMRESLRGALASTGPPATRVEPAPRVDATTVVLSPRASAGAEQSPTIGRPMPGAGPAAGAGAVSVEAPAPAAPLIGIVEDEPASAEQPGTLFEALSGATRDAPSGQILLACSLAWATVAYLMDTLLPTGFFGSHAWRAAPAFATAAAAGLVYASRARPGGLPALGLTVPAIAVPGILGVVVGTTGWILALMDIGLFWLAGLLLGRAAAGRERSAFVMAAFISAVGALLATFLLQWLDDLVPQNHPGEPIVVLSVLAALGAGVTAIVSKDRSSETACLQGLGPLALTFESYLLLPGLLNPNYLELLVGSAMPWGRIALMVVGPVISALAITALDRRLKRPLAVGAVVALALASGLACGSEPPAPASESPEAVRFPSSDGGVIHAHLYGEGSHGVVLAHGGRFNKESWAPQARILAQAGYRVLAFDFRGYGSSTGPGQGDVFTAPLHLDVLAAVRYLRESGARQVSAVGGSLGGGAAASAAAAQPGSLDRLVLLGSTPDVPPDALTLPKLYIATRDDTSGSGPRLPGLQAHVDRAPEPKHLILLDGTAHAQFMFDTEHADRIMREILRFLGS